MPAARGETGTRGEIGTREEIIKTKKRSVGWEEEREEGVGARSYCNIVSFAFSETNVLGDELNLTVCSSASSVPEWTSLSASV